MGPGPGLRLRSEVLKGWGSLCWVPHFTQATVIPPALYAVFPHTILCRKNMLYKLAGQDVGFGPRLATAISDASCCLLPPRGQGDAGGGPEAQGVNAWPTLQLQGPTPSYYPAPALLGAEQTAILGAALAEATKAPIVSDGSCRLPLFPEEPLRIAPRNPRARGSGRLCCPWGLQGGAQDSIQGKGVGVLEVAVISCLWDSSKDKDSVDRTGCQVLGPHLLCPPLCPSTQHMALLTIDVGNK